MHAERLLWGTVKPLQFAGRGGLDTHVRFGSKADIGTLFDQLVSANDQPRRNGVVHERASIAVCNVFIRPLFQKSIPARERRSLPR